MRPAALSAIQADIPPQLRTTERAFHKGVTIADHIHLVAWTWTALFDGFDGCGATHCAAVAGLSNEETLERAIDVEAAHVEDGEGFAETVGQVLLAEVYG